MLRFYKWGFFLLLFISVVNTYTLVQTIASTTLRSLSVTISSFASLLFSYLIAGFFFYLWSGMKPVMSDDDFEKDFK